MHEAVRLLRDLVARPSVNPMGRPMMDPELTYEHRVTAYLEDFFRGLGVPYEKQTVAPLRENVIARWPMPGARRTIILEAHQDTVPTDQMTIEPFAARIEGGRLYGRGACDIKGGLAAMLAAFARVVRDRPRGAANVVMACSVDEEHTFLGVQRMVQGGLRADAAIVAEPTRLNIVNAHKGVVRWHLSTTGRACHSSAPERGVNAIYRMARLLVGVEQYAEHLRASRADPVLGPPTLSVGRIEGGTSVNTVPDFCRVEVDRRLIPGEDPQAAPGQLADFLNQQAGIDFPFSCNPPWMAKEALSPVGSEELVRQLGEAIDSVVGQHAVIAVPYGTDASTLARGGTPSVVFGPGDIAQAHTCDEWVPLDEVEQASEILYRFICA
ncbi:MAG: M20 family metallopeptidase [Gemmataceae bacterium]|nr:M20 family metallopeptidase [Gemmataceae bacterium]MDW8265980.1 M20 family metallopeptidase [Gemmataceae bacterium]